MMEIYEATLDDLELASECYFGEENVYIVAYDNTPVALIEMEMHNNGLYVHNFETMYKGYGAKVIDYIFKHYPVDWITGKSTIDSYRFWDRIGATTGNAEIITRESATSDFVLTLSDFYTFYGDCIYYNPHYDPVGASYA